MRTSRPTICAGPLRCWSRRLPRRRPRPTESPRARGTASRNGVTIYWGPSPRGGGPHPLTMSYRMSRRRRWQRFHERIDARLEALEGFVRQFQDKDVLVGQEMGSYLSMIEFAF